MGLDAVVVQCSRRYVPAELPKKKKYDLATRLALPSRLACTGDEDAWRLRVTFTFCAGARDAPAVGQASFNENVSRLSWVVIGGQGSEYVDIVIVIDRALARTLWKPNHRMHRCPRMFDDGTALLRRGGRAPPIVGHECRNSVQHTI